MSENYSRWVDERGWHNCMVSMPGLSNKEIVGWCNRGRKEFYFRPGYILRKGIQVVRQPREARRIAKAGKTFLRYFLGRS